MLLHWGEEYLRRVLPDNLADRLIEVTVDPHYNWKEIEPLPHLDADTGEIVRRVQMPVLIRVSRKRLREFLSQNQKLKIQCNKRLQKIGIGRGGQVEVEFEDGTRASGACVIGTDGSKSRVRDYLCGEKAKLFETDLTMINHVASYDADQALFLRMHHPIVKLAISDRQETGLLAVIDASDKQQPENWKFQVYCSWKGPPFASDFNTLQERLHFFQDRLSRFCEPWRTAGLALKADEVVHVDSGAQFAPYPWNNKDGKVTLAGDAAHAMLPHRGQGLNNAIQDASEIVDALIEAYNGTKSLKEAIDAYEAEMIPRGSTEVRLSYDLGVRRVNAKYEDDVVQMGLNKPGLKI
ncbi:hypothetical protein H2200_007047 [Cladophialophora chaetospira]|uniref:FAD-binding domain-containing protein n=1 Tax=Cladophialophora chaetospira TaxID=386627 RepID=A0AA38X792_9EURO|nr:hypothetical protein H2200_007047 [Cladophialophora chaetospira]